jgi:hypothetical protein
MINYIILFSELYDLSYDFSLLPGLEGLSAALMKRLP